MTTSITSYSSTAERQYFTLLFYLRRATSFFTPAICRELNCFFLLCCCGVFFFPRFQSHPTLAQMFILCKYIILSGFFVSTFKNLYQKSISLLSLTTLMVVLNKRIKQKNYIYHPTTILL